MVFVLHISNDCNYLWPCKFTVTTMTSHDCQAEEIHILRVIFFSWLLLNGDGCAVLLAAWFSQSLQSLTLSVDNERDVQVVAHRRWQEKWRPINTQVSWKPALALSSTDRRRVQSSAPSEVHRSWMMTLLSRAGLLPSEILPQVDTEHKFRTKYWQSCTSLAPKLYCV